MVARPATKTLSEVVQLRHTATAMLPVETEVVLPVDSKLQTCRLAEPTIGMATELPSEVLQLVSPIMRATLVAPMMQRLRATKTTETLHTV